MKVYTGIGSRETPEEILEFIKEIAAKLEELGWICRSGGASGADLAFENGIKEKKEIYIPWKGFNGSKSELYFDKFKYKEECLKIAAENHPDWSYLKEPVRKLMARNVCQIKGLNINENSKFVICWTKDGCESHLTRTRKTGGTGLAISVASKLGIHIYNLKNEDSYNRLKNFLKKHS